MRAQGGEAQGREAQGRNASEHDAPGRDQRGQVIRRLLSSHEAMLAGIIVVMAVVLSLVSPRILSPDNILTQLRFMSELGLIALAMTLVIISGGIDLSVGAIFGLVAIVFGMLWKDAGIPLAAAAVLALCTGALAGALNGAIVVLSRMPPFIVTIGTLALFRGIAEGLSQNRSATGFPEWFYGLGQGYILGLPTQLVLFIAMAVAFAVLLNATTFGRATYAIGSNEDAALFSGVRVNATRLWLYALSGLMSGLAAIVFVSRVTTTRSDMGIGMELDAITSVVLGGTSIFGGRGTIVGTVLALVLVQLLKNGLSLAGVRGDGTVVVIGSVLIATILISNALRQVERA